MKLMYKGFALCLTVGLAACSGGSSSEHNIANQALSQNSAKLSEQADKSTDNLVKLKNQADKPAENLAKPENQADKSADNLGKPENQADKPADNLAKPENQADKPAENLVKPNEQADKPAENLAKPENQADKPAENLAKPENQADKSADNLGKPNEAADKPTENPANPIEQADKLAESPSLLEELKNEKTSYAENHQLITKTFIVPRTPAPLMVDTATSSQTKQFKTLIINNKEFEIFPADSLEKIVHIENAEKSHYAIRHKDSLVGFINQAGEPLYVFTQAMKPTAESELPKSGVIFYQGRTIHGHGNKDNSVGINQFTEGEAELLADFGAKVITARIQPFEKMNNFKPINLKAKIKQNYFIGEDNGAYLEGGFFGSQASSVSGLYLKDDGVNSVIGVFSASEIDRTK